MSIPNNLKSIRANSKYITMAHGDKTSHLVISNCWKKLVGVLSEPNNGFYKILFDHRGVRNLQ